MANETVNKLNSIKMERKRARQNNMKFCNKCHVVKNPTDFHQKRVSKATGKIIYQSVCKVCKSLKKEILPPRLKRCNMCHIIKEKDCFYPHGKTKKGLLKHSYICKMCDDAGRSNRRKKKSKEIQSKI